MNSSSLNRPVEENQFLFVQLNRQLIDLEEKIYFVGEEAYSASERDLFIDELKNVRLCAGKCYSYLVNQQWLGAPNRSSDMQRLCRILHCVLLLLSEVSRPNIKNCQQLTRDIRQHILQFKTVLQVSDQYLIQWKAMYLAMRAFSNDELLECIRGQQRLERALLPYENNHQVCKIVYAVMKEACLMLDENKKNRAVILEVYKQLKTVLEYPSINKINACMMFALKLPGRPSRCGNALGYGLKFFCLSMMCLGLFSLFFSLPLAVSFGWQAVVVSVINLLMILAGYLGLAPADHLVAISGKSGLCEKLGLFADQMQRRFHDLETSGEKSDGSVDFDSIEGVPMTTFKLA